MTKRNAPKEETTDKIYAKKSLGQNFLTSKAALNKIAQAGEVSPGDLVLEIGPGKGALTEVLLESGAHIIAVEKDARMIPILTDQFADAIDDGRLTVIHDDILDPVLLATLIKTHEITDGAFKLVANIPYYITGLIFRQFLEHGPRPTRLILLVQKEVAEQIVARPISAKKGAQGKESILSIAVKAFGTPRIVAKVPRGAFVPPPNVDSAILAIEHISDARFQEAGITSETFFTIVRGGFHAKRKTLLNNLTEISILSKQEVETVITSLNINPRTRPEDLTVNDWFVLAKNFSKK
jgi:16S rRNA (adenine1518-N6/adenine1519-N6)-dimethyltransferase